MTEELKPIMVNIESVLRRLEDLRIELTDVASDRKSKVIDEIIDFIYLDFVGIFKTELFIND